MTAELTNLAPSWLNGDYRKSHERIRSIQNELSSLNYSTAAFLNLAASWLNRDYKIFIGTIRNIKNGLTMKLINCRNLEFGSQLAHK